jgi:hypothetical protein
MPYATHRLRLACNSLRLVLITWSFHRGPMYHGFVHQTIRLQRAKPANFSLRSVLSCPILSKLGRCGACGVRLSAEPRTRNYVCACGEVNWECGEPHQRREGGAGKYGRKHGWMDGWKYRHEGTTKDIYAVFPDAYQKSWELQGLAQILQPNMRKEEKRARMLREVSEVPVWPGGRRRGFCFWHGRLS